MTELISGYSLFSNLRKRIGVTVLVTIFSDFREQLKAKELINKVFIFIDARSLVAKAQLWERRDAWVKKSMRWNNQVLPKVPNDGQAPIGWKGEVGCMVLKSM